MRDTILHCFRSATFLSAAGVREIEQKYPWIEWYKQPKGGGCYQYTAYHLVMNTRLKIHANDAYREKRMSDEPGGDAEKALETILHKQPDSTKFFTFFGLQHGIKMARQNNRFVIGGFISTRALYGSGRPHVMCFINEHASSDDGSNDFIVLDSARGTCKLSNPSQARLFLMSDKSQTMHSVEGEKRYLHKAIMFTRPNGVAWKRMENCIIEYDISGNEIAKYFLDRGVVWWHVPNDEPMAVSKLEEHEYPKAKEFSSWLASQKNKTPPPPPPPPLYS